MATSFAAIAPVTERVRRIDGDLGPGARLTVDGPAHVTGRVDRAEVQASGELTIDGRAGGSVLIAAGDLSLAGAHCCGIRAGGTLRLSGSGASDCDVEVEGDLIAMAHDSAIHSGLLQIGGRLQARELSGRVGARLRVLMTSRAPGTDLLVADIVGPGVEIVACGELLRFDRHHTGVRIGIADGRAVVLSA